MQEPPVRVHRRRASGTSPFEMSTRTLPIPRALIIPLSPPIQSANHPQIICHCLPCRRLSGSAFSTNIIVPRSSFRLTPGTPKTISRPGDSGLDVTLNFCDNCGHTIFVTGESEVLRGNIVVKAGTLDDPELLDKMVPADEIYTEHKVSWVQTSGR